jgi:hypothetical protein
MRDWVEPGPGASRKNDSFHLSIPPDNFDESIRSLAPVRTLSLDAMLSRYLIMVRRYLLQNRLSVPLVVFTSSYVSCRSADASDSAAVVGAVP